MAISHDTARQATSVFWTVDKRIDSEAILSDLSVFQDSASHPMLAMCIMYAALLRMSEQRRTSIKERLRILESALHTFARKEISVRDEDIDSAHEQAGGLESLFGIVHSCGQDQASREGQYEFWQSFDRAIDEGFRHTELWLHQSPDPQLAKAHEERSRWKSLYYRQFEILIARDKDHINRVENISNTVSLYCVHYNFVGVG
jgi:hypothetical protein